MSDVSGGPTSKQNHIGNLVRLLRYCGFFNDRKNVWSKLCYRLYTAFVISIQYSIVLVQILYVLNHMDNLEGIVLIGYAIPNELAGFAKQGVFLYRFNMFRSLIQELNNYDFEPENDRQRALIAKFHVSCDGVLRSITGLHVITALAVWLGPLIEWDRRLPFPGTYVYDWEVSPLYELSYLQQCTGAMYGLVSTASMDIVTYHILAFLALRCELMRCSIEGLMEENASDEEFEARLRRNMIDYKKLVEFKQRADDFLSISAFTQFLGGLLSTCMDLFNLRILMFSDTFDGIFFTALGFQMVVYFQLFLFSWFGEIVIIKSGNIAKALYDCNWTAKRSRKFKKDLLLFLARTQKPLKVIGMGFFELSLESYKGIMKTSWSYFMVLNQVYQPKER